jgi:hypothetical protein
VLLLLPLLVVLLLVTCLRIRCGWVRSHCNLARYVVAIVLYAIYAILLSGVRVDMLKALLLVLNAGTATWPGV